MTKILAPNKEYTGVSASVSFVKGVGETDNKHLIQWFKEHGYEVEEVKESKNDEQPKGSKKSAKKDEQPSEIEEAAKSEAVEEDK